LSVTVSLTGSIKATDSVAGTIALSKVLSSLTTAATTFSEASGFSVGTSPVTITLPISPVTFVYIKNTHATQTLTVIWTPNGGASATVIVLQAGAWINFGEATALSGITALSLTGSGASTTCEYVLGR